MQRIGQTVTSAASFTKTKFNLHSSSAARQRWSVAIDRWKISELPSICRVRSAVEEGRPRTFTNWNSGSSAATDEQFRSEMISSTISFLRQHPYSWLQKGWHSHVLHNIRTCVVPYQWKLDRWAHFSDISALFSAIEPIKNSLDWRTPVHEMIMKIHLVLSSVWYKQHRKTAVLSALVAPTISLSFSVLFSCIIHF